MKLNIVIYPDETGGYVAECPALPGCVSQGETLSETRKNIRDAIRLYLEVMNEQTKKEKRRHPHGRLITVSP